MTDPQVKISLPVKFLKQKDENPYELWEDDGVLVFSIELEAIRIRLSDRYDRSDPERANDVLVTPNALRAVLRTLDDLTLVNGSK